MLKRLLFAVERNLFRYLLIFAIWSTIAPPASAQTGLRYHFKKGETLQYYLEQKITTKLASKSIKAESSGKQGIEISWTVKDVSADGKATINVKFGRMLFNLSDGREKLDYDSGDGREPEGKLGNLLKPMLKAVAGLEFDFTMDARGRVGNLRLSEKSQEKIKSAGSSPGLEAYSPEELEKTMSQALPVLPAKPVKAGATWTNEIASKTPLASVKVEQILEYKGQKIKDGKSLAEISVRPSMTLNAAPKVALKLKEQKAQGAALFDANGGRVVEYNLTQNMILDAEVNGQAITQELRQNISFTLR